MASCCPAKVTLRKSRTSDERFQRTLARLDKSESTRYSGMTRPWETEDGDIDLTWSRTRILLAQILRAQKFEMVMGLIIVGNIALIIIEADKGAKCYPKFYNEKLDKCPDDPAKEDWIKATNWVLLIIYSMEAALRLYAERMEYFSSRWNCLDLFVVVTGLFSEAMQNLSILPSVAFLRIFRIARLSRAFRIVLSIRELYMLITGLGSSARAIFFGMLLLFFMLALWSILLVEFVHPINSTIDYLDCDRCGDGFRTVWDSMITLFQQIVTGDSWGRISIPVIEKEPWTAAIFAAVVVTISLGVMNLILAVIVESAAEAREADVAHRLQMKRQQQAEQKAELVKLCVELDKDKSGTISLDEMHAAWDVSSRFQRVMNMLEVRREEIAVIFSMLDRNSSGEVDYAAFVDQIYQIRSNDVRTVVAIIRHQVEALVQELMNKGGHTRQEIEEIDSMVRDQGNLLRHQQSAMQSLAEHLGISISQDLVTAKSANLQDGAEDEKLLAMKVYDMSDLQSSSKKEGSPKPAKRPATLKVSNEHADLVWDDGDSTSSSSGATAAPSEADEALKAMRLAEKQFELLLQHHTEVVRMVQEHSTRLLQQSDHLATLGGLLFKDPRDSETLSNCLKHLERLRMKLLHQQSVTVNDFERKLQRHSEEMAIAEGMIVELSACLGHQLPVKLGRPSLAAAISSRARARSCALRETADGGNDPAYHNV